MEITSEASHIIGLTGLPSVGKGEVACALAGLAAARGWRLAAISFSDQIKDEAKSRGIPEKSFTREILSRIGTELRAKEGPGVLAARIARKIKAWPGKKRPEVFVCDGVRHPGEVEALRAAFGKRFTLVAVESEPREIVRRLIARHRPDESPDALRSEDGAIRLLEQELSGAPGKHAPNVGDCIRQADHRIANHGTLEDLRRAVAALFDTLVQLNKEGRPTCLFTGRELTAETKEEHTIPASLGGRIRSRKVSSSEFNARCGEKFDKVLADTYRFFFMPLAPALAKEHDPGETLCYDEAGRPYVTEEGVTGIKGIVIAAYDDEGKPKEVVSSNIPGLNRWFEKSGVSKGSKARIVTNVPMPDTTVYREQPLFTPEAEVSALKCCLLTFDHLLADQPLRRFTRFPQLEGVRNFIKSTVMGNGGVAIESLYLSVLGNQFENEGRYNSLLSRLGSSPTQEFEHVLIASGCCNTKTLDLVWSVAGIEWLGFRVSRAWDAFDFTCVVRNQILKSGEVLGPTWANESMILCKPTVWRSAPGPGFNAKNYDTSLLSAIRKNAYQRAVYYVEMNVDESVKGAIIRAAEQDMQHSHSISEAIVTYLCRFWSTSTTDSANFQKALLKLRERLKPLADTAISESQDAEAVDWTTCIRLFRDCLRSLREQFGLPGDFFVKQTRIQPYENPPTAKES